MAPGANPQEDREPHKNDVVPSSPSVLLNVLLPRTVKDVKETSRVHSNFSQIGLPDTFEFRQWCLFVPKPGPLKTDKEMDASSYLVQYGYSFADSLPNHVLMVTRVVEGGAVDQGFIGTVKRALRYQDSQLPLLVFLRTPQWLVYEEYGNVELLSLKNQRLDAVVLSLGDCSKDAAARFVDQVPSLLAGDDVPVDALNKLLKRSRMIIAGKNVAKKTFATVAILAGPVGAFLKFYFGSHGHGVGE